MTNVYTTTAELARLKSGHYYKFEESEVYRTRREAAEAKERAAVARQEAAERAEEEKFRKAPPGQTYITGPKGGCYYMSKGKKVYVDHSYCR